MKERATAAATIAFLLLIAYVLINIVHVVWAYVNPEGFWSFQYFMDLLRAVFFVLLFTLMAALVVGLIIKNVFGFLASLFRKTPFEGNLLRDSGMFLLALVLCLVEYVWTVGFQFHLDMNLADKYSYISQSKKLLAEGRFGEALSEADAAFKQAQNQAVPPSSFFFLTRLYHNSAYADAQRVSTLYATTISYAYCLENSNSSLKAEELYVAALKLSNNEHLITDPQYKIFPLTSLSQLSLAQAKYGQAEDYFRSLLTVAQVAEGQDAKYAVSALCIFAARAQELGQYDKVTQLFAYALKLYEKSNLSKTSSNYITLLLAVGLAELNQGHMTPAGQYLVQAQELVSSKKAKQVYLNFLLVKSRYCVKAAQEGGGNEALLQTTWYQRVLNLLQPQKPLSVAFFGEAQKSMGQLVDETKSRNGENSLSYAESLSNLAVLYTKQEMFAQAQALNKEALRIIGLSKQDNQELYYTKLLQSVEIDSRANKRQDLSSSIRDIENYYFKALAAKYVLFTEEEREQYVLKTSYTTDLLNSIRINQDSSKFSEEIYNSILATKSVALFSNQHIRSFITESKSPALTAYFDVLEDRAALGRSKYLDNVSQSVAAENSLKIREKNILQALVANPRFVPFNPGLVQWKDVRAALKDKESAVEILATPSQLNMLDSLTYYALIIRREYVRPKLVRLFRESQLARLLNQPGTTEARINGIYSTQREAIYKLIWEPIAQDVAESSKIYLSVSGILHTVSFSALLQDVRPEIVLLSSTRQIALPKKVPPTKESAALFGDIDYDITTSSPHDSTTGRATSVTPQLKRPGFARLPYTANEVTAIKKIIASNPGNKAVLFRDSLASETEFRRVVKSGFNIIHVATHGFYLQTAHSARDLSSTLGSVAFEGNPLSRSGITLAGANSTLTTAADCDGILTSEEMARMDMSHVDLVVLSACETGLGAIKGSEGVYGLQRALKMAGVRSSLVSLWKVPDKQTAELMTFFYTYYSRGVSKASALKEAQVSMKRKYSLPFCWAGFQLSRD